MAVDQSAQIVTLPGHQESFKAFNAACAEKGLLNRHESLESRDICDGLSDPSTLLRFLTARRFDPDGAVKQFQEGQKFREDKHIIRLYDLIEIADYEQARQIYPHWTGRRDKKGLPIFFYDADYLNQDALSRWEKSRGNASWRYSLSERKAPKPDMLQLASVYYDSVIRFIHPLCSMMKDRADPSSPVTSSIFIVDASNLGIKQGWSVRTFAQEITWLLSTCYPETIDKLFVCNAPSYFTTIWKILKSYVDPATAEKLTILLRSEVLPMLREHIDDANIPVRFGGGLSFTHGQLPDLESEIKQYLGLNESTKSLPPGPIKWIEELDGSRTALAVGSEAGSERSDRIATVDSDGQ